MTIRQRLLDWIEALESDKFKQWRGGLKSNNDNAYCCLGVACQLASPKGWTGAAHILGTNNQSFDMTFGFNMLNKKGLSLYGLSQGQQQVLMNLNDSGGSFKEIAEYIREEILPLYPEVGN